MSTISTARSAASALVAQLHQTADALASIATSDLEAATHRVREEAQALQARLLSARAAVAADLAEVVGCFAALTADLTAGLEAPATCGDTVSPQAPVAKSAPGSYLPAEPTAPKSDTVSDLPTAPAIPAEVAPTVHNPAEAEGADATMARVLLSREQREEAPSDTAPSTPSKPASRSRKGKTARPSPHASNGHSATQAPA